MSEINYAAQTFGSWQIIPSVQTGRKAVSKQPVNLYWSSYRPENAVVELRLSGNFSVEDLAEAVDLLELQIGLIRRYIDRANVESSPETVAAPGREKEGS